MFPTHPELLLCKSPPFPFNGRETARSQTVSLFYSFLPIDAKTNQKNLGKSNSFQSNSDFPATRRDVDGCQIVRCEIIRMSTKSTPEGKFANPSEQLINQNLEKDF